MHSFKQAAAPSFRSTAKLSVTIAITWTLAQAMALAATPAVASPAAQSSVQAATDNPAPTIAFDIQTMPMSEALTRLGEQSGLTIIVETKVGRGIMAAALSGRYTAQEALRRLLEPAGLEAEYLDSRTVAIRVAVRGSESSQDHSTSRAERDAALTRIAQASAGSDDPRASEPDGTSRSGLTEGNRSEPGDPLKEASLEEVLITGTHIRGVQEASTPTLQFSREEIAKTGYSSVEQLFASLPQNFNGISPSGQHAREGGSRLAVQNIDRATGIDLRGLGADSTLTLVNGQRRAGSSFGRIVDVSAIPLSAIERVEIVTGGRSAVYGADAVAGVVNLVTRRQFDGVESQIEYGGTRDGAEHLQFSTITGMELARGGFAASYDYSSDWPFDAVDAGLMTAPDGYGGTPLRMVLQPRSKRHSALLSGSFEATDNLELHGDALYSHKNMQAVQETLVGGAPTSSVFADDNTNEQYSVSLGARLGLGEWELKVDGSRSEAHSDSRQAVHYDAGYFSTDYLSDRDSLARVTVGSVIADGPLFTLAGVTPRAAIGVEARRESYALHDRSAGIAYADAERTVRSAFAELLVPLVEQGTRRGLRKLELTLAGRYDDYDDFGDTVNPQAGIVLQPVETVTLRGAYSRAFRAPALIELIPDSVVLIRNRMDPTTGGLTPVLNWTGNDTDLGPEKASTWSVGVDLEPSFVPGTRISLSYFEISYKERIDQPAISETDQDLVLVNQDRFAGLVHRSPGAALIAQIDARTRDDLYYNYTGTSFDRHAQNIFSVFPNLVVFDNRTSNIAVEKLNGIDLQIATRLHTAVGGLNFGLNGTYTLQHDRSVTVTSPAFELLNEVGKPVAFRLRGSMGWERGAYSATAFVNYTDSYSNPFTTPASGISSWTTVDATLRVDGAQLASAEWLRNLNLTFVVNNLFDRDPPAFRGGMSGLRFDVTNAQPLGRYTAVRIVKAWR
jgi:outer membrane receptor protein involved in Fe transport